METRMDIPDRILLSVRPSSRGHLELLTEERQRTAINDGFGDCSSESKQQTGTNKRHSLHVPNDACKQIRYLMLLVLSHLFVVSVYCDWESGMAEDA